MECAKANSLEVFVADDALEGGAFDERQLVDDCEIFGEGNALESVAASEGGSADSFEVFVEDNALEGGAMRKCLQFDDFELIGESDTREGVAILECVFS